MSTSRKYISNVRNRYAKRTINPVLNGPLCKNIEKYTNNYTKNIDQLN